MVWVDLARDGLWRRAIVAVMLATGACVALLGLIQNATSAPGIYWESSRMPGAFFGTFFHHTAAGAYLNTVWPLGLALALDGIQHGRLSPRRGILIGGSLACAMTILVAHAGHVSRFPQVIATVALVGFSAWTGLWRVLGRVPRLRLGLLVAALAAAVSVGVAGATRIDDISSRWHQLQMANLIGGRVATPPPPMSEWPRIMRDDLFIPSDHRAYPLGDRGATYATALAAIAERPWFGWSPGGWMAAASAHSVDPFVRTFFLTVQFTHNDLLQACVEWGLVGATGWMLVIGGAVAFALGRLRQFPARDYLAAGAAVGLTSVLVQSAIDFPLQIPAVQFNALALAGLAWSAPVARTPLVGVSALPSL
jgi:O-antigen ligase